MPQRMEARIAESPQLERQVRTIVAKTLSQGATI